MHTVEVKMRAFNQNFGSPSMALVTESVDVLTALKQMMSRLRKKTRQVLCTAVLAWYPPFQCRNLSPDPSLAWASGCVCMRVDLRRYVTRSNLSDRPLLDRVGVS